MSGDFFVGCATVALALLMVSSWVSPDVAAWIFVSEPVTVAGADK